MTVLRRVARNVSNLERAAAFYAALGFSPLGPIIEDAELAAVLGVQRVMSQYFSLGRQQLELTQCTPAGLAYPAQAHSSDIFFQHIAILASEIFATQAVALRAGAKAISQQGPQSLPAEAGGVVAWKFRDPDGHPLEFLQLPGATTPAAGYDHSAICVADAARSIRFYQGLGFELKHRHVNHGPAQNRLDGLAEAIVEVVALRPASAPPHLELLAYRGAIPACVLWRPNDIAADRLVFSQTNSALTLQRDPDGHLLLHDDRA